MCLHSQFPSFFPIFRVVSIGVEVEKLLADPSSDLGLSTSVEFCGGTHLKNISHIGHLVITTEEAIAKGVRRIVAVTGPEAERAIQRSERLEQRLVNLSKRIAENKNLMEDRENFKRIGKEIIEFIQELSLQMLPYWRKDAIREIAKGLQKQLDTSDRQAKAAVTEKLLVEAKAMNESISEGSQKVIVHVFGKGANAKALDSAVKQISKVGAVIGFSVDEDLGKVLAIAKVDKKLTEESGLKASEWINQVCDVIGGRGGGKDQQAQATGDAIHRLEEAVEVAQQFAQLKLSPK